MTWRRQVVPVVSTFCLTWCVIVGFVIWFTPMHYVRTSGGVQTVVDRPFSDVSANGALPLVIPVAIAGLGTWGAWRNRRLALGASAVLLAAFTVISGFSIGAAYVVPSGLQLLAFGLAIVFGRSCGLARS